MKSVEYIIDNVDGSISLHKGDRQVKNDLADNKGETIGVITTRLIGAIEQLRNGESLHITFTKME